MRSKFESLGIIICLCLIKLSLTLTNVQRTVSLLRLSKPLSNTAPRNTLTRNHVERLARKIEKWADILPLDLACLPKALTLAWCLRRRHHSAKLCIGIANSEGFQSHAWVETNEGVYGENPGEGRGHQEIWSLHIV